MWIVLRRPYLFVAVAMFIVLGGVFAIMSMPILSEPILSMPKDMLALLPPMMSTLPKDLKINLVFDQLLFARASIEGVVREATLAFLGNCR